jgi:hypothetical protein
MSTLHFSLYRGYRVVKMETLQKNVINASLVTINLMRRYYTGNSHIIFATLLILRLHVMFLFSLASSIVSGIVWLHCLNADDARFVAAAACSEFLRLLLSTLHLAVVKTYSSPTANLQLSLWQRGININSSK